MLFRTMRSMLNSSASLKPKLLTTAQLGILPLAKSSVPTRET